MKETTERDRGLLSLVERMMKKPDAPAAAKPVSEAALAAADTLVPIVAEEAAQLSLEPQVAIETTRALSRTALSDVILRALMAVDDCPPEGFEVVIYGSRPWNAMLRITPAAGALVGAEAWRTRVRDMIPLLRDQYDLVDEM